MEAASSFCLEENMLLYCELDKIGLVEMPVSCNLSSVSVMSDSLTCKQADFSFHFLWRFSSISVTYIRFP
jgi:hypothetical protein